MIRERDIERRLKLKVEKAGGLCWKFLSTVSGVPDRICLFPGGILVFAELKAPGKKLRPLQKCIHDRLKSLGFQVVVLDSFAGVDQMIEDVERRMV